MTWNLSGGCYQEQKNWKKKKNGNLKYQKYTSVTEKGKRAFPLYEISIFLLIYLWNWFASFIVIFLDFWEIWLFEFDLSTSYHTFMFWRSFKGICCINHFLINIPQAQNGISFQNSMPPDHNLNNNFNYYSIQANLSLFVSSKHTHICI